MELVKVEKPGQNNISSSIQQPPNETEYLSALGDLYLYILNRQNEKAIHNGKRQQKSLNLR